MMTKLQTFYSKLSTIFLILILLLGTGILYITFSASKHLFDEVEQLLNKDYALSISKEISPFIKDGFSEDKIKDAIHYMMVLNPMIEIYLINSEGYILSYFTGPGDKLVNDKIDLKPINDFLDINSRLPILGDDPRSNKNKKPFSASKIKMGNNSGYVYIILRGENYDRSIKDLSSNYYIKTGISTLIFAILTTLILGFILFFILTKRLRILNNTVQNFKQGDYSSRVNIKGNDELTFLGQTFNDMAESIQIGVQKLQLADKEKSDLITNISHDLRSPLTSIRGHLETIILKDLKLTTCERLDYLNISLKNVSNLQTLVDKLFELAKLENNQARLNIETFDMAELCQDVLMKLKPKATLKSIILEMAEPQSTSIIKADIGMIERVISNILENSINYTHNNGLVELKIKTEKNYIMIIVKDNGCGIPKDDQSKIFDRFYRGKQNNTDGTGLGLAIVKEIILLHKGTINLESNIGEGTKIYIKLPLNP